MTSEVSDVREIVCTIETGQIEVVLVLRTPVLRSIRFHAGVQGREAEGYLQPNLLRSVGVVLMLLLLFAFFALNLLVVSLIL